MIALMEALSKLDCPGLRDLLEENSFRLTDSRHMMNMMPFILEEQHARVKDEIQGKDISIIFDGTTRLGEVLVVVVRFHEEWTIKQRLVSVQFLQKSVNGDELARLIISILSVSLGVESGRLLACNVRWCQCKCGCLAHSCYCVPFPLGCVLYLPHT